MKKILQLVTVCLIVLILTCFTSMANETITLKVAHQWPQNPEDPLIATTLAYTEEITEKTNGTVQFEFYPASSLVKPTSAFQALQRGTVDMSILPYIYASGIVPELNFSQWVCVFKSHDDYFDWRNSEGFKYMEEKVNDAGVKTLVWLHYAVSLGSTNEFIALPEDAKGKRIRANGRYPELLFIEAGTGISTMVPGDIYTAAQRGMIDGMVTSSASMAGYKLFEVFDNYLSSSGYSIDYGMEPICISMDTWDNKLNDEQREIFLEVAKKAELFGLEKIKEYDKKVAQMFVDAGCEVREMSEEEFIQWQELAEKAVWPIKKTEIPNGDFFYKDVGINLE
jgi:TRAP-type transport system periplasmic protein